MGLAHPSARLVDARSGATLVGPELARRVEATAASIAALPDGVVFLRFPLDVDSIVGFLGAWSARRAVALVDPDLDPALLNASVDRYEPAAVLGADPDREAPATHCSAATGGAKRRRPSSRIATLRSFSRRLVRRATQSS
jgi:acyl-CoA synthetase (AMP-forming)/AMP-acid ligase II